MKHNLTFAAPLLVAVSLFLGLAACGPNPSYIILVTATPSIGTSGQAPPPVDSGLPTATLDPTQAPTPTFIPTPNPTRTAVVDPNEDQTHIVQFGDTLSTVASLYGVTVESI
ncbi:MAG: hypothetical protein P8Z40_05510, partial [Chloroflexota bacterium]